MDGKENDLEITMSNNQDSQALGRKIGRREELREQLKLRDAEARMAGGKSRVEKQHEAGKLTARERIEILLDPGTFVEMDRFRIHQCRNFGMDEKKYLGDGLVSGFGQIDGRQIFIYAQDFTIFGGSLSETVA